MTQEIDNAVVVASDAILDRARGAFLGLAVGDALGTTLEFSGRDSLPYHTEMTGGGPFDLAPGVWTDDTSMAMALADSLIACGGFDAADAMNRFVRWWRQGEFSPTGTCFDIGIATARALARYAATGEAFAGSTEENTAGNGSLMRLAPAVLHALDDAEMCRRIAAEQSRTTHGAPQSVQACVFFADVLRRAILGEPKESLLAPRSWDGHEAMRAVATGTWRGRHRDAIRSSGYAIHTLEAALWAVSETDGFEAALVLAVNLADDADSVGAVTGQLAGAIYGASAIPPRWLAPLAWREEIHAMADSLLTRLPSPSGAGRPGGDAA
jgi:ADP-ribosyl-[dinitrogen reductase] hydrolase